MLNKNKSQTPLSATKPQDKQNMVGNIILFATASLSLAGLTACQQPPDYNYLIGETMGTSYHISYQLPKDVNEADSKLLLTNACNRLMTACRRIKLTLLFQNSIS